MRKMGPLPPTHPCIEDGDKCVKCKKPFMAGEYVTLVELPIELQDADVAADLAAGRATNCEAMIVHWDCVRKE